MDNRLPLTLAVTAALLAVALVPLSIADDHPLVPGSRLVDMGDRFVARITLPQSVEDIHQNNFTGNATLADVADGLPGVPTRTPAATVLDLRENELVYFDVAVWTGPHESWYDGNTYGMSPISPALGDQATLQLNIYPARANNPNFEREAIYTAPISLDGTLSMYEDGPRYAGERIGVPVSVLEDYVIANTLESTTARFAVSVSGCHHQNWTRSWVAPTSPDRYYEVDLCGESFHSATTNYLIHNGLLKRAGTREADNMESNFFRNFGVNLSTPIELYKSGGDMGMRGTSTGDGFLARIVFPQADFQYSPEGALQPVGDTVRQFVPSVPLRTPAGTVVYEDRSDFSLAVSISLYEDYGFNEYNPARDGNYMLEFYHVTTRNDDGVPGYAGYASYPAIYAQPFQTGNGDPSDDGLPGGEYGSGFRTVVVPTSAIIQLDPVRTGNHFLVGVRDCNPPNEDACRTSMHSVTTNTMLAYGNQTPVGVRMARDLADRIETDDANTGIRSTATPFYMVTQRGTAYDSNPGFGVPYTPVLLIPDEPSQAAEPYTGSFDVLVGGSVPSVEPDNPNRLKTQHPDQVRAYLTVGRGPYIDMHPGDASRCELHGDDFFANTTYIAQDQQFALTFDFEDHCAEFGDMGNTTWGHLEIYDGPFQILTATNPAAAPWMADRTDYEGLCRAFLYGAAGLPAPGQSPTNPTNPFYGLADTLCSA